MQPEAEETILFAILFALPVCSSSKATRSQPLQLRLQIGNEVPVKQHERKCYYINLYHLHIYPALSLGPFDLLGCLKF